MVIFVLSAIVLDGPGAAAQDDPSLAIETHIEALADADPEVRERAAYALGEIGPAAAPAVPALIEALANPDRDVRRSAAGALGSMGPAAALAVPALLEAATDLDREVRRSAADALLRIGPRGVTALADALADPDRDVRRSVVYTLSLIGPAAAAAVPPLIEALADPDQDVRRSAAEVLGRIGPAAVLAVPALIDALADPDQDVRWSAADALGSIGPAGAPAVPALTDALADPDARRSAASGLGGIGPAAAPAVPALIDALADPDQDARQSAAFALGQIGPAAAPAVPALIDALADPDQDVRWSAADALGSIGPAAVPAVPALIDALADSDQDVRRSATVALGGIGPAAAPAVPALIDALADPDQDLRWSAADALGQIGPAAAPAVPTLVETLADPDQDVRRTAAGALGSIATSLRDEAAVTSLGALQEALKVLETHTDLEVEDDTAAVRRAIEYLELLGWEKIRKGVFDWIHDHYLATFSIGAVPIWLALCFGLFWFSPATVLRINNVLRPFDFKLPDRLGGMTVSLRHLLLVGVLNYRPRVLDAWVSHHVGKARENFKRKRTVEERSVHVPVPVHLDKETIPEIKGPHLRGVFEAGSGRLLIWGEGGSGKTSIACQIARWAMTDAADQRPAPHRMLPVLIERELDFEVEEGKDPFTETVRGDLETLIEARVGDELLGALLERRRVLVIIDHLSEMTDATRRRVRPDVPDFPAAALIVTSRLEERLGDQPSAALQPMRVTGDYLFEFMGAYLRARGVREEFPDHNFGRAGARIAELVGERAVTVLLVKLYLDRLIETKRRGGDLDKEMPESIPSLMLHYLNDINRAVPDGVRRDERAVHRDAEAGAWACLEERFRPGLASIDRSAIPKLAAVEAGNEKERLDYLEKRLRLIETVEPEREQVRFLLDPVAEYLAGLHLVREHGQSETSWRSVLERLDATQDGLEAIRGFILALRDCCLYRPGEVPDFLAEELAKRGVWTLRK